MKEVGSVVDFHRRTTINHTSLRPLRALCERNDTSLSPLRALCEINSHIAQQPFIDTPQSTIYLCARCVLCASESPHRTNSHSSAHHNQRYISASSACPVRAKLTYRSTAIHRRTAINNSSLRPLRALCEINSPPAPTTPLPRGGVR
jgi:hypothetical protein